ncbi:hypothetical protein [Streptomyces sp. ODS28]|uniref:hypothetical protein n=1 Tax=Streptomyces sp. ODS28 TaxID=3136688 RepID=UPI0031E76B2A
MIKKILSGAGVAASLVGVVAMTAPQAMAAPQDDANHSQSVKGDGEDKGGKTKGLDDTELGKTLKEVPVLKGNGVSH